MKKRTLLTFVLLLTIDGLLNAQTRQISGRVSDADSDESLPGVTVIVKENNSIGTITDAEGNYTLDVPVTATALIFRSVGYNEQEAALGSGALLNIQLKQANYNLDAVVVSASRRQEKILDAPASISLITTEQIKNTVAVTPMANLKGVPGRYNEYRFNSVKCGGAGL